MRIVWTSDWSQRPRSTGFSRASDGILRYLQAQKHEVVEVAVGYEGFGDETPWKTYPTTAFGGRLEGQDIAPAIAQNCDADALVLLMDFPDQAWAIQYHDKHGNPLPEHIVSALDNRTYALCMYAPVDGACPDGRGPRTWRHILRSVNTCEALASPSKFGAAIMADVAGRECAYLPHGVNPSVFKPMNQKECRKQLGIPENAFVVGYVGVNKQRKQVPCLFEAVAKFRERKPEVEVCLIVHADDREGKYDLQGLADAYGLEKGNSSVFHTNNLTEGGLAMLYNTFDVFLCLSGGEGFCIPIIEAQACRVPALVTAYSSMPEIVPDAEMGWSKVPVRALVPMPYNNIMWAWPDVDEAAARMAALQEDRGLNRRMRGAAWEMAMEFKWDRVGPMAEKWIERAAEFKRMAKSRVRVEAVPEVIPNE